MGTVFAELDDALRRWIDRQRMFFVATAPLEADGHVNLSPKGDMRTFAVLDPLRVAYVDFAGSGIETVAHVRQNGRIVLMLCAFEGPPRVLRLHGTGAVLEPSSAGFEALLARFPLDAEALPLVRAIVTVDIERIADSCGFVVPRMRVESERDQLVRWARTNLAKHGDDAIRDYCAVNNGVSIDGLAGLDAAGADVPDALRAVHGHAGRKL